MSENQKPVALFLAGTNGSGKSTLREEVFLNNNYKNNILIEIDSDKLTKECGGNARVGAKKAIEIFNDCIKNKRSFSMESTLCGKSIINRIKEAKENGFEVNLKYIGLNSADLNVKRVEYRVANGGHNIPKDIIIKRYVDSRENLKNAFDYIDNLEVIDNSKFYKIGLIIENKKIIEHNAGIEWIDKIKNEYENNINKLINDSDITNNENIKKLIDKQLELVWKEQILEKNTLAKPNQANPSGYILGGQPGAGKSNLLEIIKKDLNKNAIIINGDDFRKYHPDYKEFQKLYGQDSPKYTANFAGAMSEAILNKAIKERYNIAIEGTFRTIDTPKKTALLFKNNGYKVGIKIQTCNPEFSWKSCVERYEKMLETNPNEARYTDQAHHNLVVKNLSKNIKDFIDLNITNDVEIYLRDDKFNNEKIFDSKIENFQKNKLDKILATGIFKKLDIAIDDIIKNKQSNKGEIKLNNLKFQKKI